MAYRQRRPRNLSLLEGATDGTYKQLHPDWANVSDYDALERATELAPEMYGSIVSRHDTQPFGVRPPKGTA